MTVGIRKFLDDNPHCVRVEVVSADGSTPREAGTWMLVSPAGAFETIGGGQLEYMAIDRARAMMADATAEDSMTVPLGPEIGQCCGGRVVLRLRSVDGALAVECIASMESREAAWPDVYLFGAGHVGNALARALMLLPLRTVLVDTREAELADAPEGIETLLTPMPEAVVRQARPGSAFVILTHDHSLDFLIASEVLARGDAAYAGMIGSKTKRETFRRWYARQGGSEQSALQLRCPIGGPVRDKRPAVIASFVAAEIMAQFANVQEAAEATALSGENIS